MATILTKKKDTTGAPSAGDLTNDTGGAELAVNTADKRLYTKDSGGNVVEIGTNPTSITTGTLNTSGQVVFNDAGADVDFRVESDTVDHALFVEGSSGNVGIGTSSPATRLDLKPATDVAQLYLVQNNGDAGWKLHADSSVGSLAFQRREAGSDTERARITNGGFFKASNTGSYANATSAIHEFVSSTADWSMEMRNTSASSPNGLIMVYTAASPNGTANNFFAGNDSTARRCELRSNGGLANFSANNVNLASDERLKKDISPLTTSWDKVKSIEVVNFRYKDCNEGDPLLYGVIAQQVQTIVPELVLVTQEAKEAVEPKEAILDEDGNVVEPAVEAKEATPEYFGIREQPMYWLAIKALQEAMERIEALEAKVAALEAK